MGFKRGKSLNHSRSSGSVFPEVDLKKLLSKSFFFFLNTVMAKSEKI